MTSIFQKISLLKRLRYGVVETPLEVERAKKGWRSGIEKKECWAGLPCYFSRKKGVYFFDRKKAFQSHRRGERFAYLWRGLGGEMPR